MKNPLFGVVFVVPLSPNYTGLERYYFIPLFSVPLPHSVNYHILLVLL